MSKLLLVEDDNNLREIYEARLQAEGYQIVSARDGEEALVVAKAEKPDLIISDVMMPKISGFEMLDILRNTEELKDVKVIMLTALGQSDDQQRADKLGADRYLVKSQVTLEDIIKVTHELLGDQPAEAAAPAPVAATVPGPASTPAPEPPAPAPAPAPAPEPKAEPVTDGNAKSATQEEADVEAKIEDFVAGATSEPTESGGTTDDTDDKTVADDAAPAELAPPAEPVAVPEPTSQVPTQGGSSDSDDKLMADAVETLVTSTDKTDKDYKSSAKAGSTPGKTTIPVSTDLDSKPAEPAASDKPAAAVPATAPAVADDSDDKPSHAEKVIQPLNSMTPKKDINQLLAEEEAKTIKATPSATVVPTPTEEEDRPAGAPMETPSAAAAKDEPAEPAGPDPGSIAL